MNKSNTKNKSQLKVLRPKKVLRMTRPLRVLRCLRVELLQSHESVRVLNQLRWIVANTVFEYDLDILNVCNIL